MNLAVEIAEYRDPVVMAEEIGIQCLRVIEFKFRPSFYNFQQKQGSKFAVCSEEDKMLPMDLSPRGYDGVEDLFRSFEPNQVQLVGHRMMGLEFLRDNLIPTPLQ
jgi:hypothetical protein